MIHLYLVDENIYPKRTTGDDESTYQELLKCTTDEGILWNSLELDMRSFEPALQVWDAVAGNSRLLLVCTFNFYPNRVLPPDADISGTFGFFPKDMVKDIAHVMKREHDTDLNASHIVPVLEKIKDEGDIFDDYCYEMVRDNYFMTFRDAAEQGKSIAVIVEV